MSPMTTAIFSAMVAALATLIVSFWAFRWGFIPLHEGRRMVFVFEPDMKAAVLAISSGVAVFFLLLWRSSHNSEP